MSYVVSDNKKNMLHLKTKKIGFGAISFRYGYHKKLVDKETVYGNKKLTSYICLGHAKSCPVDGKLMSCPFWSDINYQCQHEHIILSDIKSIYLFIILSQ